MSDNDNAIMHNIGSARFPIVKPKYTATSDILSNKESRKDPFFDMCLVILATVPSITSKNPEINSIMPPRIVARYHINPIDGAAAPYRNADIIDDRRLNIVQKFGDKQIEAKKFPSLSTTGCSKDLNLLSKYQHLSKS